MRFCAFVVKILVVLVAVTGLFGQEYRATLLGHVVDSSGAAVPAARVTATNTATGVRSTTDTNTEGNYTLPYLQPGEFRLRVEHNGFKALDRGPIELRVDERVRVDAQLEVGALTETITVTAETPLLDVVGASAGQTIEAVRIAELPIAEGVAYHMIALSPGVNKRVGLIELNPYDSSIANYAVGGNIDSSAISIDGVVTGVVWGGAETPSFSPPQETVQELRVQTTSFDAMQGFTQAANINISFKSGTNIPHGAFYLSMYQPEMTAIPYFSQVNRLPKADNTYKRFGGAFGGPVVIPRIYNGKNRTFFFFGPEKIRLHQIYDRTYTVPTAKEVAGDFSDLLKVGSQYQIYDPATRRTAPNGRYIQDPFLGNIIPPARISPITTNMLKNYFPAPIPGAGTADGTNNYPSPTDGKQEWYWAYALRVDHNISDRHRVFFSTHFYHRNNLDGTAWLPTGAGLTWTVNSRGAAFDDVYTISPSFLMNVRVGWERLPRDVDYLPWNRTWSYADNGWPAYLDSFTPPELRRMPTFAMSGYTSLSVASGLQYYRSNIYTPSVHFTKSLGAHTLRFGAEGRLYRGNVNLPGPGTTGAFTFGTSWTQGPYDNSPASPIGQGLASALLGLPTTGGISRVATSADQSIARNFYFQEDWHVNSRLSLNLGLRYEYEGPVTERYNRSVTDFNYSAALPIAAQVQNNYAASSTPEVPVAQFLVKGGLNFAGVGGQPRQEWPARNRNFLPRIGFAYSLNSKTVVRGGYGIYYGVGGLRYARSNQIGFSQTTPLVPSLDGGLTFVATLANPFPNGYQNPTGASLGASTYLGQSISFFDPRRLTPYTQRWQLGVQRQLPARLLLEVNYAGNRGTHLDMTRNLNALPNQYLSTSPVRDNVRISYLSANLPNPFYPLLPSTSLAAAVIGRSQLLLPYPQFTGMNVTTSEGYSWYHSMQLRAERRMANGITAQFSYTWSKWMIANTLLNAADPRPERVIAPQDFTHNFSFSSIVELPFGRGHKLLPGVSGSVDRIIGGWQLEGVWRFQSGPPLGFGNAIFTGNLKDIPLPSDQQDIYHWFNVNGFQRASSAQLASNLRTFPSAFSGIRGPHMGQWDLSAIKKIPVHERLNLELRAEFLNAFNAVDLSTPNTTPSNTSFGMITTEIGTPRAVYMGLWARF